MAVQADHHQALEGSRELLLLLLVMQLETDRQRQRQSRGGGKNMHSKQRTVEKREEKDDTDQCKLEEEKKADHVLMCSTNEREW